MNAIELEVEGNGQEVLLIHLEYWRLLDVKGVGVELIFIPDI